MTNCVLLENKEGNSLRLWSAITCSLVAELDRTPRRVSAWHWVAFESDVECGSSRIVGHLVVGHDDGHVDIWRINKDPTEHAYQSCCPGTDPIYKLQLSKDSRLLACVSENTLTIWAVATGILLRRHTLDHEIFSIGWNCTSDKLALEGSDRPLLVFRMHTI